jgi:hypothetical protein
MYSDSNSSPRFAKRPRPFKGFRVDSVERDDDSGESAVRGTVSGRDVEVRYVETSGEFRMVSGEGDVAELSRSDLRDLGPALAQFQNMVPWADSAAGFVLRAVNDAIFPTTLRELQLRSVSDLGGMVLVTGWTRREEIDLVLDTRTGELSIIVTSHERKAARRPITSQEAWDLAVTLSARIAGKQLTTQTSLIALVAEAARRQRAH